jgi:hypothetical protein
LSGSQGFHDSINAITGQTENYIDSPIEDALNQNIRCPFRHGVTLEMPQAPLGSI